MTHLQRNSNEADAAERRAAAPPTDPKLICGHSKIGPNLKSHNANGCRSLFQAGRMVFQIYCLYLSRVARVVTLRTPAPGTCTRADLHIHSNLEVRSYVSAAVALVTTNWNFKTNANPLLWTKILILYLCCSNSLLQLQTNGERTDHDHRIPHVCSFTSSD